MKAYEILRRREPFMLTMKDDLIEQNESESEPETEKHTKMHEKIYESNVLTKSLYRGEDSN